MESLEQVDALVVTPVSTPVSRWWDATVLVRAGLWLAGLALGLWFLTRIEYTLTIFGLAWLIAYLMNPLVVRLEGHRLGPVRRCPRGLAVGVIYLCIVSLLVFFGSLLFPTMTSQVDRLMELQQTIYNPHQLAVTVQDKGERLLALVPQQYRAQMMEKLRASLGNITKEVGHVVGIGLSHLASFFGQVVAGAVIFLSALLISIYIILSWNDMGENFVGFFPQRYRNDIVRLIAQMNSIFGGYLRATILTSVITGLATTVTLGAFALISGRSCPYTYVIGLIVALLYPIPLFGILASTVAGAVLGFMPENELSTGLWVGLIVFVVMFVLDRTLQPKLMGNAIGVSPLFVIFAAAAGGEFLGGVWGMLLGIPLAAMTKALLLWIHDLFLVDPGNRRSRRAGDLKTTPPTVIPLDGQELEASVPERGPAQTGQIE